MFNDTAGRLSGFVIFARISIFLTKESFASINFLISRLRDRFDFHFSRKK